MNKNMETRELWIVALSESISKPGHYALILEDTQSKRRIPLIIGVGEAQAIAIAMEKMQPSRPQTHDLFQNTLLKLNASLTHIVINRLEKEIFYANIILKSPIETFEIDARPSDAIALAVRFGCPIYATSEVIENSAYDFDEKTRDKRGSYAEYTLEELDELLAKIIKKEDYESAARVRDAIERRKS
jgi:uncharacterized protein